MKRVVITLIFAAAAFVLVLPFLLSPSSAAGAINVSSAADLKEALMMKGDLTINIIGQINYTIPETFQWADYDKDYSSYIFADVAPGKKTVNMNGHSILITDNLIDTAVYTVGEHYNVLTGETEKLLSFSAEKFVDRATLFRIQTGATLVINGENGSVKMTSKVPAADKMLDSHVMTERNIFLVKGGDLDLIYGEYTAGESALKYVMRSRTVEKKADSADYKLSENYSTGLGEYCINGTDLIVKGGNVNIFGSSFNAYGFRRTGQDYSNIGTDFKLEPCLCLKADSGNVTIYDINAESYAGADFASVKKGSATVVLKSAVFNRTAVKGHYLLPDYYANNNSTVSKMMSLKYYPGTPMHANCVVHENASMEVDGSGFKVTPKPSKIGGRITWEDGTEGDRLVSAGDSLNAACSFDGSYFGIGGLANVKMYAALYVKNSDGTYSVSKPYTLLAEETFDLLSVFDTCETGKNYMVRVKAEETRQGKSMPDITVYSENCLCFTVSSDNFISTVSFAGKHAPGDTVGPQSYGSSLAGSIDIETVWYENGVCRRNSTFTVASGKYEAVLYVTAKEGYVFSEDVKTYVDGKEKQYDLLSGDRTFMIISAEPVTGKCDHSCGSSGWSFDTDCHYTSCAVCGTALGKEPHTFDEGTGGEGYTVYTCTVCGYEKKDIGGSELITDVTVVQPVLNPAMSIGTVRLAEDIQSKVNIESVRWLEGYDLGEAVEVPSNTKAESGWYILELKVSPKQGYCFDGTTGISYKSGESIENTLENGVLTGIVRIYSAESVSASVKIPRLTPGKTIGDIISEIEVLRGTASNINVNYYFKVDGDKYLIKKNFNNTLSAGYDDDLEQVLAVKIKPSARYGIEIELSKGNFNIEPSGITLESDSPLLGCTYYCSDAWANAKAVIVSESDAVTVVNIDKFTAPEAGASPDNSCYVPEGSGAYIQSAHWDTMSDFQCGHTYSFTAVIKPESGLCFKPETLVLLNGKPVDAQITDGEIVLVYFSENIKHSYSGWEVKDAPSCTAKGTLARKCAVCGASEQTDTPSFGHSLYTVEMKRPTCVDEGCKTHKVCAVCGKFFDIGGNEIQESSVLLETDSSNHAGGTLACDGEGHYILCKCGKHLNTKTHTFGEFTSIKAATLTETGLKQKACTECGYIVEEEIPLLEPSHEHVFEMRYDEDGHYTECSCGEKTAKEYHTFGEEGCCTVCGYKKAVSEVTPTPSGETPMPTATPTQRPEIEPTEKPSGENEKKASAGLTFTVILAIFAVIAAVIIVIVIIMRKKG